MISEVFSLEEDKSWWVDSGATRHVCNNMDMFKTYKASNSVLYMGNHSTAQVKGKGKVTLEFTSGNTLTLNDVLHVPDVRKNLVSGSILNKHGFKLVFESDKVILSKGGRFVGKGYLTGGMFKLNINNVVNNSVNNVNMIDISNANNAVAPDVHMIDANNTTTSSAYFDYSLLLWHDDVLEKFKIYEVELKCDTKIKCLRTDRGGEYYNPRYFESMGIIHQVTAPYTPQQNGIAERKNRTLMEMVNSMMSYSGLSSGFWGEALLASCYILNRVPSKRSQKTPYELWNQRHIN
ncbi:hypothetical protein L6452_28431 [Arctium lappa]|uniref:Uncharacterized protein n=1 Tax=Arctium lappa TaxID=4217 RepID=A0ACB8ZXE6_ARCLA|nr:hypothetical protein L6452_28431 [Arctium lappa]